MLQNIFPGYRMAAHQDRNQAMWDRNRARWVRKWARWDRNSARWVRKWARWDSKLVPWRPFHAQEKLFKSTWQPVLIIGIIPKNEVKVP